MYIFKNKTIFISPLDWGLGHATRCVPIIQSLKENNKVILGVTQSNRFIFDEHFPDLQQLETEPYKISYSAYWPLWLKLLFDSPRIKRVIKKEQQQLEQWIDNHKIEVVISDNRFGLYSNKAECIYITHQLSVKAGLFSWMATQIHQCFIEKFNSVWVPDFEAGEQSLAGDLSKNHLIKNVRYLGPLSRLKLTTEFNQRFDYLCMLSGPEPLRTQFEKLLIKQSRLSNKKIALVRGTALPIDENMPDNLTVFNTPGKHLLSQLICGSHTVICRSGYSSLMDLHQLKAKHLILVPTPGQHEQIYLAEYWKHKFGVQVVFQKNLNDFSFE